MRLALRCVPILHPSSHSGGASSASQAAPVTHLDQGPRRDRPVVPALPLATWWPQKTVGTRPGPWEEITDRLAPTWVQPLDGSQPGQLQVLTASRETGLLGGTAANQI